MLPHEQVMAMMYSVMAALQLTALLLRPSSYLRSRHKLVLFNRLLRLTIVLLTAVMLTPAQAKWQVEVLLTVALGVDISTVQASTANSLDCWTGSNTAHVGYAGSTSLPSMPAAAAAGSTAYAAAAGSAPVTLTTLALAKAFFRSPPGVLITQFSRGLLAGGLLAAGDVPHNSQHGHAAALCVDAVRASHYGCCGAGMQGPHLGDAVCGSSAGCPLPCCTQGPGGIMHTVCDHPLAALLLVKVGSCLSSWCALL